MIASPSPIRIGLIGTELSTTLSPPLHEGEAAALGIAPYSYEVLDFAGVENPDLGVILSNATEAGFTGFNVTHPFKQAIIPHLDALDPTAEALGAVNTIVIDDRGKTGHNTDYTGFLAGLRQSLPSGTPRGSAVLFGAGGAGSAVAAALVDFGVRTLRIIDTHAGRLEALTTALKESHPAGPDLTVETASPSESEAWVRTADGVVNATPVGMDGVGGTPWDTRWLSPHQWVADVVYRPVVTQLLAEAMERGCSVIPGTSMLLEQAADGFELLTGTVPNRERMRTHLAELLGRGIK
jgi:shikimate dehydrogenase